MRRAFIGLAVVAACCYAGYRVLAALERLPFVLWVNTAAGVRYGPHPENVLDILTPRRPAGGGPRPGVIVFHGGGWIRGSRAEMANRVCRRYLARGFTVANVEYRLGLAAAAEDAVRAVEWFRSSAPGFGVDPRRIVATGESAGGHLALLAAFRVPDAVAAVVNFYGLTDLPAVRDGRPVLEAAPGASTEWLERLSPVAWTRPGLPPVLSVHGDADTVVPIDQMSRLTRAVRRAGGSAFELRVENGGHGFSRTRLDGVYAGVFEFLERAGVAPR